jgi:hypothetical protein
MYIRMHTCIYIFIHVYMYTYICTYIRIGKTGLKFKKEVKVVEGAIVLPPVSVDIPPNTGLIIDVRLISLNGVA